MKVSTSYSYFILVILVYGSKGVFCQDIKPLHVFVAHQCGTDALDIVSLHQNRHILVSGGDDQSLFIVLFETAPLPSTSNVIELFELFIVAQRRFENLHTSAISGSSALTVFSNNMFLTV
jgi:hypothetical protein